MATELYPYFAWVGAADTTWNPAFARWDEQILSYELTHEENNFCTLTVRIKNPRGIGILAPSRKRWAWLSRDVEGVPTPRFFGRVVGVPSDLIQEVMTLVFVAMPQDVKDQKATLADTLRQDINFYDPIFFDEERRNDPDVVLEAYSRLWYYDPVTHVVSTSDEVIGEDGTLIFGVDPGDVFYNGLEFNLGDSPATSATVTAELTWTQKATGQVDLTSAFSGLTIGLDEGSWPGVGASLGGGWTAVTSSAKSLYDHEVKHRNLSNQVTINWWDGESTTINHSSSDDYIMGQPPAELSDQIGRIITDYGTSFKYEEDPGGTVTSHLVSFSENISYTDGILVPNVITGTVVAGYKAEREYTERVTMTLQADVQPILSEPGEDATLILPDLRSVNLSEALPGESAGAEPPIGDPRRRSYIVTERGLQTVRYMVALLRAHLLTRSRAVNITFLTVPARMIGVTLRKNVELHDARLPGGEATGKIIRWSESFSGGGGAIECAITIGCAAGNGGTISAVPGTPLYVEEGGIEPEGQEFVGGISTFTTDVGYTPPLFAPNDDGLDFISGIEPAAAFDTLPALSMTLAQQLAAILPTTNQWDHVQSPFSFAQTGFEQETPSEAAQQLVSQRQEAINAAIEAVQTQLTFKMKSMSSSFDTPIEVELTELKVPTGIDLAAPSG